MAGILVQVVVRIPLFSLSRCLKFGAHDGARWSDDGGERLVVGHSFTRSSFGILWME